MKLQKQHKRVLKSLENRYQLENNTHWNAGYQAGMNEGREEEKARILKIIDKLLNDNEIRDTLSLEELKQSITQHSRQEKSVVLPKNRIACAVEKPADTNAKSKSKAKEVKR